MVGAATIAGELDVADTLRICVSLFAPGLIPESATVCAPAFSWMTRSASGSRVGGSFTEETDTVKAVMALAPWLSETVTVIIAVPNWFASGVTFTMRLVPLPPRTMLAGGITPGLEEPALTARLEAGVSVSATVKAMGPAEVSSAVNWLGIEEIAGELFCPCEDSVQNAAQQMVGNTNSGLGLFDFIAHGRLVLHDRNEVSTCLDRSSFK